MLFSFQFKSLHNIFFWKLSSNFYVINLALKINILVISFRQTIIMNDTSCQQTKSIKMLLKISQRSVVQNGFEKETLCRSAGGCEQFFQSKVRGITQQKSMKQENVKIGDIKFLPIQN